MDPSTRLPKVSRRELARMVAGLTAARALAVDAQTPAQGYTGPLTGVTKGLEGRRFDPVAYTLDLHDAAPRTLRFQAKTRAEADRWQTTFRAKLAELVGGFPTTQSELRPATLESRRFNGYTRDKVLFDAAPGISVLAYVVMPDRARRPAPAVICIPGHGRGVDDIVGVGEKGEDRTERVGYQFDFALQVAEAGMAAVAIEPMGFGCRRDPINARVSLTRKACEPVAGSALMLGQTLVGWRVWDVMRTIDFIGTRPDLDASRVACMGISGGGTATLFASALDTRIRAAMVSGYLNTFRDSIGSLSHCVDNYVPGILNWGEMYDIAGLVAPRPFFAESGERDTIFPIKASIASFAKVREIYGVFGAADRVEHEVFAGEHLFWGRRGIPFLAKHLGV